MSETLSRAELEAMDRDELVETIVELSQTVDDLQHEVEVLDEKRDVAHRARQDIREENQQLRARLDDMEGRLQQVETKADGALQSATDGGEESKTDLAKRLTRNILVVRAAKNTAAQDRPVTIGTIRDRADEDEGVNLAWSLVDHAWDSLLEDWPQFHETTKRGSKALSLRPSNATRPLVAVVEESLDRDDLTKRFFGGNGGEGR